MNNNWYPQHPNHQYHPDHQQQQWQNNWQNQGSRNHSHPEQHMPAWNRQVTIEEAMNIARNQVQGQVVKVELEHEQGVLVYEVDIITQQGVKYEVIVNANTGGVLSIELD